MRMYFLCLISALFAVCLLLTGSVTIYTHALDPSGSSVISKASDLTPVLQSYPGSLDKIKDTCNVDPSLGCSVSGTEITISQPVAADNPYYTVSTEIGFPFITTTLTVDQVPVDLFDSALNRVLTSAGLTSSKSNAKPIDLRDKSRDALLADAWSQSGMQINYSVVMPNGQVSSYNIIALMADSAPIVVTTQEPNWGLIVLVIGVLVLAAFALSFLRQKKKGK
jgi:hypothetical protein